MSNALAGQGESTKWNLMVNAAKRGATEAGYKVKRVPGRGLSNVVEMTKDGKTVQAAIRAKPCA